MNEKILTLLGFACKAGRLSFGMDASITSVRNGESELIVAANDISDKSMKEICFHCEKHGNEIIKLDYDMKCISLAVGRKKCGIISVNDKGFADAIKNQM